MSRYYLQANQCQLQRVVQYDNHGIEHTLIKLSVGDKCITNEWTFPVNTFNRIVKHVYRAHQAINTAFHTKRYVDVGTIYEIKLNDVVSITARQGGNYYLSVIVTIDDPFTGENIHVVFVPYMAKYFLQQVKNV